MPKLTVLEKVLTAIRALREAKGSSRVALQKYLKAELDCENVAAIRQVLKKGVKDGVLVQVSPRNLSYLRQTDDGGMRRCRVTGPCAICEPPLTTHCVFGFRGC
jgi:hypothetical protein